MKPVNIEIAIKLYNQVDSYIWDNTDLNVRMPVHSSQHRIFNVFRLITDETKYALTIKRP